MEERVSSVEGNVRSLIEWRTSTVDPWIREDILTHKDIKTYMDQAEAREVLMDKLSQERHEANSFKMNLIIVIGTVITVLFGAWSIVLMIQSAKTHSLARPLDFHSYLPQFAQSHDVSTIPTNP